jgi:hypothetical protein
MSIQNNFPAIQPTLNLSFALTKALDPRITYTRATTATYYDGKTTALAEQNLILYSQQFQNAVWGSRSYVTDNFATAPNGTQTAAKINNTTGLESNVAQTVSVTPGASYTFSFYAKNNGGLTSNYRIFNLTGGADIVGVTSYFSQINGSTWSVINVPFTAPAGCTQAIVYVSAANGLTENVLVWGAQVEQRSAATAYTPTTTAQITNYIPVLQTALSGVARFDHNPTTGESLGLLIEEQRTNLLTYSEQFDNAAWTKSNATVTANATTSPDGTLNADKLILSTDNTDHSVRSSNIGFNGTYVASVFAKSDGANGIWISAYGRNVYFSLITGAYLGFNGETFQTTFSASNGTNIGNGWWRFSFTIGWTSLANRSFIIGSTLTAAVNSTEAGNGFSGAFIWGAQLEQASFPTSYIPTVASQVTRAADAASMTGANFSSWYNQSEGCFYAEMSRLNQNATFNYVVGSGNLNVTFSTFVSLISNGNIQFISSGGVSIVGGSTGADNKKTAVAYKTNDNVFAINNTIVGTDTSSSPVFADTILLGGVFPVNASNGYYKKFCYYPQRSTNAQLQGLTS